MFMATKLARVVTDHEGLSLIKSHDPLIKEPWEIAWQTKIIIPLPEWLWPPNFAR